MSNKIGRNTPCPCGSGKKYKKCCLALDNDAKSLAIKAEHPTIKQQHPEMEVYTQRDLQRMKGDALFKKLADFDAQYNDLNARHDRDFHAMARELDAIDPDEVDALIQSMSFVPQEEWIVRKLTGLQPDDDFTDAMDMTIHLMEEYTANAYSHIYDWITVDMLIDDVDFHTLSDSLTPKPAHAPHYTRLFDTLMTIVPIAHKTVEQWHQFLGEFFTIDLYIYLHEFIHIMDTFSPADDAIIDTYQRLQTHLSDEDWPGLLAKLDRLIELNAQR